ncbi:hypothetical protein THAOC_31202 [Thalassiosira oceanica]|uniref:Uncharacterized protein n=1 Tax=Thalassiosira oceanica TaxID=159749 RepID=K0R9R5_THAOC|nr:hypothetical protein THAOC_31202 [Thalassiosira oceanica]|eukprot:EJK49875.1 hypothetical protein THAOC_31202 [Thalassiosira oceanica]
MVSYCPWIVLVGCVTNPFVLLAGKLQAPHVAVGPCGGQHLEGGNAKTAVIGDRKAAQEGEKEATLRGGGTYPSSQRRSGAQKASEGLSKAQEFEGNPVRPKFYTEKPRWTTKGRNCARTSSTTS